jgi:hypothetical protein
MSEIKIRTYIANEEYSQGQLDAIYIERARFTLHEMQNLGASILGLDFNELSPAAIDQTPNNNVSQLLLANKLRIGKNRLNVSSFCPQLVHKIHRTKIT